MGKSALNCGLAVILALASTAIAAPLEAISPDASCAATGTVVVRHENNAFEFEFFGNSPYYSEKKTLVLNLDELIADKSMLCLNVMLLESAENQPEDIKLRLRGADLSNLFDLSDLGDTNGSDVKKHRRRKLSYKQPFLTMELEDIEYPKNSGGWIKGKRLTFEVQVKQGNGWVPIDPDVVIIKPKG